MPRKGYKQSKKHIKNNIASRRRNKRKKKPDPIEKPGPPFRDPRCETYDICLKNAAYFDLELNCTNCPNKKYPDPKPSDTYFELLTQEALACGRLLRAVFYPRAWYLEERALQRLAQQPKHKAEVEEEPKIEWWG